MKNLDQEIKTLAGAKIMLTPDKALTYRQALISACETYQGQPGSGEGIKAFDLGIKIMNAKEDLELSKEDKDFLLKVVDNNSVFMAVVVGRLHEFINVNK